MGEVFAGRYELVDVLDSGGMGTVWRVWDLREETYRAAKMMRQSDSAELLRFVRETATRVHHDHVVAPTGWSAEDDRVLFAMPLIGGGSVATLIADHGPLPEAWVRTLVQQLLEALEAVHSAGLVHRDVKPANLLLDPTGRGLPHLWLSDFGIAAVVDGPRMTRPTERVHTPGYAAPEAGAGADPDPRHDLYATGIVMHEMLTGLRPAGQPSPLGGVLGAFQARLASPDPAARFGSAAEARRALTAIAVPEPVGEPVEVFDHLPPLPAGWTAGGPQPAASTRPARTRLTRAARQRVLAGLLALVGVSLLVAAALAL